MRKRYRRVVVFVALCVLVALGIAVRQYPRHVLLSDVRQADRLFVRWYDVDEYGRPRTHAFELDGPIKRDFVHTLVANVGLDYFHASVSPTVAIKLLDSDGEVLGYYVLRYASGNGGCPSMDSLRETASRGRPLPDSEVENTFGEGLRSKLPCIIACDFAYVLPVDPAAEDPLRARWAHTGIEDPRLRMTLAGHLSSVCAVAFSPAGGLLASASYDGTVKLWDLGRGHEIKTLEGHTGPVRTIAFSPDGRILASAGNDLTVKIWEVPTGTNTRTISAHDKSVSSVAFSPDGRMLASGAWDATIKLWDLGTGRSVATLRGHNSHVNSVEFGPDGTILASGSADKTVKIWDLESEQCTRTLAGHEGVVNCVAFSLATGLLASGGTDQSIRLWSLSTGEAIAILKYQTSSASGGMSVAFNAEGSVLAAGGIGRNITMWNIPSGEQLLSFGRDSRSALGVAFSPDGKFLASGSDNENVVKVWRVELDRER